MNKKNVECLFIGHTGERLWARQKAVGYMFPNNNVRLENPFNGAIAYLATYLSKRGISFDYINSFLDEKEQLEEKLNNGMILVAITTTFCRSVMQIKEVVSFVRKRNSDIKIVVGGAFMTAMLRKTNKREIEYNLKYINADFYINSFYGENTLFGIIDAIKRNISVCNINNLIYLDHNTYVFNRVEVEHGDPEGNTVDWGLFKNRVGNAIVLRTSVSCPFSCSYCSFPENAGKFRLMEMQTLEKQLDEINRLESVRIVNFIDDTLNIPSERFKDILRLMKHKKYKFRWHGYFRAQFADREMVQLMKESNCEGVFLGLESGNQRILDAMNKKAKVEEYIRGHELLKEYDITTFALFIIGFPGETKESVRDTENLIKTIKPTFYYINKWYCDTLTPIWKEKDKYRLTGKDNNWSHVTMDSETAGLLVKEVEENVKGYTTKLNVQSNYIFQVMNMGVGLERIKQVLDKR